MLHEVGIGGIAVSKKAEDIIKTYALGSCVAVMIYDKANKIGGMIHIALPRTLKNIHTKEDPPGRYADAGLPQMIKQFEDAGGVLRNSWIKMAGGASVLESLDSFNIGKQNLLAVRKILRTYHLDVIKKDVGGNISRTVSLDLTSGVITIQHGPEKWTL